jgi:hypothetical protein
VSRVALLGTNHKGKLAVLALGTYTDTWRVTNGAFTNERDIRCAVTGRGAVETVFIIDSNVIVFSSPIHLEGRKKTLDRHDATFILPAYTVRLMAPGVTLDSPAVAAINAIV